MKPSSLFKIVILFLTVLFLSCGSKKDIVYYQNTETLNSLDNLNSYEIKIQPDDLLSITVSAADVEASMPFNLNPSNPVASSQSSTTQGANNSLYLVDAKGTIEFPVLGKLRIAGKTRSEVLKLLYERINEYIKNPIINLRLMNFKISVQGEVNAPGSYSIDSERLTLIEALSKARDLTIYGRRDNVLIIREVNGVKTFERVDITKADFMNSPYYYLAQNDVVYVEPNKTKIRSSKIGADTGLIFSITSILVSVVTLIIRLK